MGILTAEQVAAIKAVRALFWTKAFTVLHLYQTQPQADYYDTPVDAQSPLTMILSGDYTWRPEHVKRGDPGGYVDKANLLLETDIDYAPLFAFSGARMIVDGVELAITTSSTYPDFGSVVVQGSRRTT